MKVRIKSVLKSSDHAIDCFEEQQIIMKSGNTLCIKQIGKNQCQFICLTPQLQKLYGFKPTTNRKGVFAIQKIQGTVELAHYSLKGTRKSVALSLEPQFVAQMQRVDLLADQYDNNLLYGGIRSKEAACVFLADVSKGKILAIGYMSSYEDLKLDIRENLTISVLCNNGTNNILKFLRYVSGQWQITQQPYKKIQGSLAHQHELLPCGRAIFATKAGLYHFQGSDLLQLIEMKDGNKVKDIVRIHRGLLVISQKDTVEVLIQDNDEVTLLSKGHLRLQLQQQDKINKTFLSHSGEEVMVSTKKNNIYSWKCQYIDLQPNHFDFSFAKIQSSCSNSHQGSISLSTGRKYSMLAGHRNVTLWSVQKNQYVLSSQFISTLEFQNKKSILCCGINPDGNSFMLAFEDKVRVYRILLTKFKFHAQFSIKKCVNIVYSHGGQLVACVFGKGTSSCLKIINSLRMVEVGLIRINAEPTQIVWNELDDQILASLDNNNVQIYSVADSVRKGTLHCNTKVNHIRIDYKSRKIMISCDEKVMVTDHNQVVEEYRPPFQDFHYIFPLYGIYFIVTKGGMLHWSASHRFEHYQSFALFTGKPFSLLCRSGYLLAYSSFQDILILHCHRENSPKGAVATEDIVMVERDQILQFYEKVKLLENSLQMLQSGTQIKLEQQKANYENAIDKLKSQFLVQIQEVNSNLAKMSNHKLKQQRQNQKVFQDLQEGQTRNVNQIESMYERKCKIMQQKLLQLQQSHLQQKQKYQNLLFKLEDKYHNDVARIRNTFQNQMKQQCSKADQVKLHVLEDKKRLEFKLVELEEENQVTLRDVQIHKDEIISKLKLHIDKLESQLQSEQIRKETILVDHQRLLDQNQSRKRDYDHLLLKFQQGLNRIESLEKDLEGKKDIISEKERIVAELTHQVGGLEKAKYVLSFRTNQIRKQLEPKQELADRLKNQLLKVDEEYKQSKKKNYELSQKLEKITRLNQTIKKQHYDTKQALKLKESKHTDLLKRLNYIIRDVNEKQWGDKLRKLNETFLNQNKFKQKVQRKKKDPAEELNRHLNHVEMSLQQVAVSNDKILRGKEKDITRRMKQNSELMLQINVKKKNQIMLRRANQELKEQKELLKKQIQQNFDSKRNSTRAQTSITKRRAVSRDELRSREKSFVMNRQGSRQQQLKQLLKDRSRVESAHKTLMYKDETRQKNTKFFQIARQLQSARHTIKVQEQMLEQLNRQVFVQENPTN